MTTRPVIDCATGDVSEQPVPLDELALREAAAAEPPSASPNEALAVLGSLTREQLQRVVTLGVLVTEPDAVEMLVAAVAPDGQLADGVAVVAEAAAAAQAAVEQQPGP